MQQIHIQTANIIKRTCGAYWNTIKDENASYNCTHCKHFLSQFHRMFEIENDDRHVNMFLESNVDENHKKSELNDPSVPYWRMHKKN